MCLHFHKTHVISYTLHPSNRFTFTHADCSAFARIWRKLTMCITVKNEAVRSNLIQHTIKTTKWISFQCNHKKTSWIVFWWHFDAHRYEYGSSCKLFVVCRILTIPVKFPYKKKAWKFTVMLRLFCWQLNRWGYFTTHTPQGWKCAHTHTHTQTGQQNINIYPNS